VYFVLRSALGHDTDATAAVGGAPTAGRGIGNVVEGGRVAPTAMLEGAGQRFLVREVEWSELQKKTNRYAEKHKQGQSEES